jgi:dihydropteroate synthase
MFIRSLHSSLPIDYRSEFQAMGINEYGADFCNNSLILKFCDLSVRELHTLENVLRLNNIPFYKSASAKHKVLIGTFPNWRILQTIFKGQSHKLSDFSQNINQLQENAAINEWHYEMPEGKLSIDQPLIMGILNVTPDSFSDGGHFFDPDRAYDHALAMQEEGADIIDIGAESTRPGSDPVNLSDEWNRLYPVLKRLRKGLKIPISIDTYKSEIASRSLKEGAQIINDISGLTFDPQMADLVAETGCPIILMHMKGTPRNMQVNPHYNNLMEEIVTFFQQRIQFARSAGIRQIIIDPGIGFGKRLEDNFEIIRRLAELKIYGLPILLGPSRKSFIGKILDAEVNDRGWGTAAAVALAINNGTKIVRIHDVQEMKQVLVVVKYIMNSKNFS